MCYTYFSLRSTPVFSTCAPCLDLTPPDLPRISPHVNRYRVRSATGHYKHRGHRRCAAPDTRYTDPAVSAQPSQQPQTAGGADRRYLLHPLTSTAQSAAPRQLAGLADRQSTLHDRNSVLAQVVSLAPRSDQALVSHEDGVAPGFAPRLNW